MLNSNKKSIVSIETEIIVTNEVRLRQNIYLSNSFNKQETHVLCWLSKQVRHTIYVLQKNVNVYKLWPWIRVLAIYCCVWGNCWFEIVSFWIKTFYAILNNIILIRVLDQFSYNTSTQSKYKILWIFYFISSWNHAKTLCY